METAMKKAKSGEIIDCEIQFVAFTESFEFEIFGPRLYNPGMKQATLSKTQMGYSGYNDVLIRVEAYQWSYIELTKVDTWVY